jgi:hypothetical protein
MRALEAGEVAPGDPVEVILRCPRFPREGSTPPGGRVYGMARELPVLAADPVADTANPTRVAGILRCGGRDTTPGPA